MRKFLRYLYSFTPISVRLSYGRMWRLRGSVMRRLNREAEVDRVLAERNIFFLLGSGRCGTQIISSMLDRADDAMVLHEPLRVSDVDVRPECRADPAYALNYVQTFRKYEIYKKVREYGVKHFGEVSSPLRCLGGALREAIPSAKFFILVRNGRDCAPSAMNRQARVGRGDFRVVEPLPGDSYFDSWGDMSPFEKACWWWMDAYRTLSRDLPDAPIIHFESMVSDYDYVYERVVKPLGLNLPRDRWEAVVSRKSKNAAPKYVVQTWEERSEAERNAFDRICGEMMVKMGYAEASVAV